MLERSSMGEGSKWALLVGIDKYHESLGSLKYAGADCRALHDVLVSGPLAFPEDQVLLLSDDTDDEHLPTFSNIHSFLGSWLAAPKEYDLVFVYFAGHGRLVDGKNYLVPGDATLSSLHTLGIPLKHVQDFMEQCKAKRKLLILDACHSGAGRDVAVMAGEMQTALAQGTGFYTISSCGADELSHEWDAKGHGVFTHFLTAALRGECSPPADGRLTVDQLYDWVHERVAKWAAQHRCIQTPRRFAQGEGTLVLSESMPKRAESSTDEASRSILRHTSAVSETKKAQNRARRNRGTLRRGGGLIRSLSRVFDDTRWQTWHFWAGTACLLFLSLELALWARGVTTADRHEWFILANVPLCIAFSIFIGRYGTLLNEDEDFFWCYSRPVLMGFVGAFSYAMMVFLAVPFWGVFLMLPVFAVLFLLSPHCDTVAMLHLCLWAFCLRTWAINVISEAGSCTAYLLVNSAILLPWCGSLIRGSWCDGENWEEGQAAALGWIAVGFYVMLLAGSFFTPDLAFTLPVVGLLTLAPEEGLAYSGKKRSRFIAYGLVLLLGASAYSLWMFADSFLGLAP